jgi:transcriptional regulator with XRE-family HTH domain
LKKFFKNLEFFHLTYRKNRVILVEKVVVTLSFASRLREARKSKRLTQENLADLIGVAGSTIAGYEKGTSSPDDKRMMSMMEVLQVDANFLFQDEMRERGIYFDTLSQDKFSRGEELLVDCYREMNEDGQQRLVEQAQVMADSGRYKKRASASEMAVG